MPEAPRIRRLAEVDADERARLLARSSGAVFDRPLWDAMREVYADVQASGDDALCRALERWHGISCGPAQLAVPEAELEAAAERVPAEVRDAIDAMIAAIRRYNERILRDASWSEELAPGVVLGERVAPIASTALYVPCGKGSFPSVMAHIGTPAVVAGVPDVIVLCPPLPGSDAVDPAVLYAALRLGLRRVYRVHGPSGIAAAALGTGAIPRVAKIIGPGSPPVMVAQLLAQEHGVITNVLQGPSESLIIADESADAELLAADLLTEAEHGHDSAATLATWSDALAEAVAAAVRRRLGDLPEPNRSQAASSLSDLGGILLCADEAEACAYADAYAVEHLQIATADPQRTLAQVRWAAEILIGQTTPMAAANFTLGVPNTLPSGGFARVSSGITARTFLVASSTAQVSAAALAATAPAARALALHEGFPAHAAALELER